MGVDLDDGERIGPGMSMQTASNIGARGTHRATVGARRGLAAIVASAAALVAMWVVSPTAARAGTPAPPEFYGVAAAEDLTPDQFNRLAAANIGTVRFTLFWPSVDQGRGYEWNHVDGFVIKASYAGVRLIPTLIGTPKHLSGNPLRPPLDSASAREQWQSFVRAAVRRYGPNGDFWDDVYDCTGSHCHPNLPYRPLTVWQTWNEPNLGVFWQPSPSPSDYAELLRLTWDAVHSEDPGAEVLTGGIMPGGRGAKNSISQNDFIAQIYQAGGAAGFDGLDLHPYSRRPRGVRRLVRDARQLTRAYGDGATPLWISEVGWSTKGPKGDDQVTSKRGQGKRLARTFKMLTAMRVRFGIKLAEWFRYSDGPFSGYCKWCPGAGLFDKKERPKPAWKKYVKVTGGKR